MGSFLIGLVAGFGIGIPVGAIAVLIVQVGMRCGFPCAASAGAGAATADLLYAILACMAILGLVRSARPTEPIDTPLPGRREFGLTHASTSGR